MILLRSVRPRGGPPDPVDVRLAGEHVVEVGPGLEQQVGEAVIEGAGGLLLPGLHDHHVHLLALAAVRASVAVGPRDVGDVDGLVGALARAATARPDPDGWVRAIGYHEAVAGPLDARRLERWVPGVPVRVQHRTGVCWVLSAAALARVPLDEAPPGGVERDAAGRPTGRLFRLDGWLREHVPPVALDLAAVGRTYASLGVTGLTDADPRRADGVVDLLAAAHRRGDLPQRLTLMGPVGLEVPPPLALGPVKVLLDDAALPGLPDLAATIAAAHDEGRTVAVHCVTRVQLVLLLAALEVSGAVPGDRVEHGAVIPLELVATLAVRGLTVVTQPNLVAERGRQYRAEVPAEDQQDLWRLRSLLDAGVAVAGGTDAPHGGPDPWRAVAAAVDRQDVDGHVIGDAERVTAGEALDLFLGPADRPSRPRSIAVGTTADLCLLRPGRRDEGGFGVAPVAATIVAGRLVWTMGDHDRPNPPHA